MTSFHGNKNTIHLGSCEIQSVGAFTALIDTNIKALVDARTGTNKALVTFRSLDVNREQGVAL